VTISFQGIGVAASRPVAIGPAFLTGHGLRTASQTPISGDQVGAELDRLNQAVAAARRALKSVREQIPRSTPINIAEFIDTHLLMLEDVALVDEVLRETSAPATVVMFTDGLGADSAQAFKAFFTYGIG